MVQLLPDRPGGHSLDTQTHRTRVEQLLDLGELCGEAVEGVRGGGSDARVGRLEPTVGIEPTTC